MLGLIIVCGLGGEGPQKCRYSGQGLGLASSRNRFQPRYFVTAALEKNLKKLASTWSLVGPSLWLDQQAWIFDSDLVYKIRGKHQLEVQLYCSPACFCPAPILFSVLALPALTERPARLWIRGSSAKEICTSSLIETGENWWQLRPSGLLQQQLVQHTALASC